MITDSTILRIFFVLIVGIFFSCHQEQGPPVDTPTSGNITIAADESFRPIIQEELDMFHHTYKDAHITVRWVNENEALDLLMNDSVHTIIIPRKLSKEEIKSFGSSGYNPHPVKIAYDALAFIINEKNPNQSWPVEKISDLFAGKISSWKNFNPSSDLGDMKVVFDNKNSSTANYLAGKLVGGDAFPAYCYALDSTAAVIDYVRKNVSAIGVVGVNWVMDRRDTTNNTWLPGILPLSIYPADTAKGAGESYQPYQSDIALKNYPFVREICCIVHEPRNGLGTGFATFIANEAGQRIILKSGLVPATAPVRLVKFVK